MNKIRVLYILFFSLILSGCLVNTDPTSSFDQNIILNKETDSVKVNLKIGEAIKINDEISIKFLEVPNDSRCPEDVICVWAGNGEVKLELSTLNYSKTITLNTLLSPRSITFSGLIIELKKLFPAPRTDREIKQSDYNIDLIIKPEVITRAKGKIILIDDPNDSQIKHDLLNINSVELNKDLLGFSVSYSGGCKEHKIELFALKGIAKSNPPQATVLLSHNANNDMCEAYLTKKIFFDLTPLKEYLKATTKKVLLIIHDPSGNPIRNPVIEYNF
jgi:hypothetical protein